MTAMKSKRIRQKSNNLLARTLVPSLLAGFTLALLVFILSYFRVDLAYGTGTSLVIFTSFASSIFIMFLMPRSTVSKSGNYKVKLWKKFKLEEAQEAIKALSSTERDGRIMLEIS